MALNYLVALLLLPAMHSQASQPERRICSNFKTAIGYTEPVGDVNISHGVGALNLTCVITDPEILRDPHASNALRFLRSTEILETTIVNGSAIRLYIDADKLEMEKKGFDCMYNDLIVCSNIVIVATPPRPTDFRCVSLNNDNFTCSWRDPGYDIIKTDYTLYYVVQNQPSFKYFCPGNVSKYDEVSDRYYCTWTLTTSPHYRQSSEIYDISFHANNSLGSMRPLKKHFHHFAHIIPNAPERLEAVNATTSSLLLRWTIPPTIQHRGLNYRVKYKCGLGMTQRVRDRQFKLAAIGYVRDKASMMFNLTRLPFAHDLCDVHVALKVNLTSDESMWSANATLFARTSATVPGEGPKLDVGSFKHINDTAVRIYWHQVPEEYENGGDLKYNVTLLRGAGDVAIDRAGSMKNSVAIGNLNASQSYTFAVYASNSVGRQSTPHAAITIPAQRERPYQVRQLKKIERMRGFELSWQPRTDQLDIANYTVFWCREITKSITEDCNGDWDWVTVPESQTQYTYHDNTTALNVTSFRVAIASNSRSGSSGMFFPTCEESGEQIPTINLMKPTPSDTSMELKWMLKCTNEGIAYYTIEYCTNVTVDNDCRGKVTHSQEVDGSATHFVVGNLRPYSTYVFTIYPTMKNGNRGKTSDPERHATGEGTPSRPVKLTATHITNSSMALHWQPPEVPNGRILYKVMSNGQEVKAALEETGFVLQDLKSYVLYNISVMACTTKNCSESVDISRRTLIGTPGKVGQPTATSINTSDILVVWGKPAEPRGPVFYEIEVDDGDVNTYTNTTEMYNYKCTHKTSRFKIVVRAVNVDKERNRTYFGEWSDEFKGNCSPGMGWLIPVMVVLGATIIGTVFLGSRKIYSRLRKMQDIDVELPKAFADPVWPSPKDPNQRETKPAPAADEELLLQSRSDVKSSYVGDSSGCSSAQGSVTSESDGTFSAVSDSGTEQGELRKRSFRNSSKTSLLGAEAGGSSGSGGSSVGNVGSVGKNENYAQGGIGMLANPLAEMDDASLSSYQPYADAEPASRPETTNSSYVTVAQARSLARPKEDPGMNRPYVQVGELKPATQQPAADPARSYVTVGQMPPGPPAPPASKLNKLYDAKLLKED